MQRNFIKGGLKNEKDNKQKKCSGSDIAHYDDMCSSAVPDSMLSVSMPVQAVEAAGADKSTSGHRADI